MPGHSALLLLVHSNHPRARHALARQVARRSYAVPEHPTDSLEQVPRSRCSIAEHRQRKLSALSGNDAAPLSRSSLPSSLPLLSLVPVPQPSSTSHDSLSAVDAMADQSFHTGPTLIPESQQSERDLYFMDEALKLVRNLPPSLR